MPPVGGHADLPESDPDEAGEIRGPRCEGASGCRDAALSTVPRRRSFLRGAESPLRPGPNSALKCLCRKTCGAQQSARGGAGRGLIDGERASAAVRGGDRGRDGEGRGGRGREGGAGGGERDRAVDEDRRSPRSGPGCRDPFPSRSPLPPPPAQGHGHCSLGRKDLEGVGKGHPILPIQAELSLLSQFLLPNLKNPLQLKAKLLGFGEPPWSFWGP